MCAQLCGGRSFRFCSKIAVNPLIVLNYLMPLIRSLDNASRATAPVEPSSNVAMEYWFVGIYTGMHVGMGSQSRRRRRSINNAGLIGDGMPTDG